MKFEFFVFNDRRSITIIIIFVDDLEISHNIIQDCIVMCSFFFVLYSVRTVSKFIFVFIWFYHRDSSFQLIMIFRIKYRFMNVLDGNLN